MDIRRIILSCAAAIMVVLPIFTSQSHAQEGAIAARALPKDDAKEKSSEEELAKKLQNPVAPLIRVPFQLNYDRNIGPEDDGYRWTLNIQPVIPFSLSGDWNLISRTILPVIHQDEIFPGAGDQTGIGDAVQSLFLSPVAPWSGWIWGGGPAFLLPTGSDELLTADKWGAGPTAVALRQQGPWTYGALVNHIWSFAGEGDRPDVDATFLQPFLSYTTSTAWTFAVSTESTYDWDNEDWSVPINMVISKVTNIEGQLVSFGGGVRYWATTPDSGPEGLGFRFVITLLFPK
jgi:hypothetical protein